MDYYWPDANYESDDLCNGIELKMAASRLSKSRIMSSLQCLKRVHLEINRKDLAHFSRATKAAFALGHEVGDIAIELYGGDQGTFIEYNGGNFTAALAKTEQLMTSMFRTPIFEATLQHGGVLVREELLKYCKHDTEAMVRLVHFYSDSKYSSAI
jgi:hypothetical protein